MEKEILNKRIYDLWREGKISGRVYNILQSLKIEDDIKNKYVKVIDMTAKEGDKVLPFTGANMSLGDMFLRFESRKELDAVMGRQNEWLNIELENMGGGTTIE